VNLRDAADYIMKLPKAEQNLDAWQTAVEPLLLVVELGGPTMMARIGMMRALNRNVERVFNPSRRQAVAKAKIEERRMKIPRGKYIAKNADPHKHEPEHFIKCETCGGWIDFRDLGSVFDHEGPHSLPSEDRMH